MNHQQLVQQWIELARWTPSADNTQPWAVDWEGLGDDRLTVHLLKRGPAKNPSQLDQALQQMALGSLVTSLTLAAREDGYVVDQLVHSNSGVAVRLSKGTAPKGRWKELLVQRCTNRQPYLVESVAPEELAFTQTVNSRYQGLQLCDLSSVKSQAARLVAKLDRIRYQNERHLNHLLEVLRFGGPSTDGLDVKSLDIPLAATLLFRALRQFGFLRFIFFLGLERIFSFVGCRHLINKAGHFFLLRASDQSPASWFELGRCFQELWLEATRHHLALQPFGQTFITNEARWSIDNFSASHLRLIHQVHDDFLKLHGEANLSTAGIFFRLGKAKAAPRVRSQRRSATDIIITEAGGRR